MENVNLTDQIRKISEQINHEAKEIIEIDSSLRTKENEVRNAEKELAKAKEHHDKLAQEVIALKAKKENLLSGRHRLEAEMHKFQTQIDELNRNTKR